MYPDPDPKADQFDEALERRHQGGDTGIDDPELQELLLLAEKLDQDLPDDLPDPAFRDELKNRLLFAPPQGLEPIDLSSERWYRSIAGSSWRLSAAAAAFTVVFLVVAVMGLNWMSRDGEDDPADGPIALQETDDDAPVLDDAETFVTGDAGTPTEQEWVSAGLPPFDTSHVVLNPLLGMPLGMPAPRVEPLVAFGSSAEMPDMPDTATVYYLSAPPDPEALISNAQRALDLEGDLVPGSTEDVTPYRLVNDDGLSIIEWDPGSAFFHYIGDHAEPGVNDFTAQGDDPADIAQAFLETIGFDLYSIEYDVSVDGSGATDTVRFEPSSLPETGLDLSLGATVVVNEDGQVTEAMVMWLSLSGQREAAVRSEVDAWNLGEKGDGFWPPNETPDGELPVEVFRTRMVYLLTRYDHDTYVLQPAIKFMCRYSGDDDDPMGAVRFYVPAIDTED